MIIHRSQQARGNICCSSADLLNEMTTLMKELRDVFPNELPPSFPGSTKKYLAPQRPHRLYARIQFATTARLPNVSKITWEAQLERNRIVGTQIYTGKHELLCSSGQG
eukprot:TRINITY_DN12988_c0_g1_i1.p1 TRINITY_DN12988_c0_g1~~TRINITY_DN12988_c0_g1_i1.p1  ORF type:complete len:108 (-),score=10.94 TRINITY_DN12988_c0_g1_i1:113-436(-)